MEIAVVLGKLLIFSCYYERKNTLANFAAMH